MTATATTRKAIATGKMKGLERMLERHPLLLLLDDVLFFLETPPPPFGGEEGFFIIGGEEGEGFVLAGLCIFCFVFGLFLFCFDNDIEKKKKD